MADIFTHSGIVNNLMTVGPSLKCIVATFKPIMFNQIYSTQRTAAFKEASMVVYKPELNIYTAVDLCVFSAGLFACFVVCMWNAFRP